jgi:hypothetical protein
MVEKAEGAVIRMRTTNFVLNPAESANRELFVKKIAELGRRLQIYLVVKKDIELRRVQEAAWHGEETVDLGYEVRMFSINAGNGISRHCPEHYRLLFPFSKDSIDEYAMDFASWERKLLVRTNALCDAIKLAGQDSHFKNIPWNKKCSFLNLMVQRCMKDMLDLETVALPEKTEGAIA